MKTLNEGTQATAEIRFYDLDDQPVVPDTASVTFVVRCETNGTTIRSGSLTSAATILMSLTAEDVAIIDSGNLYEYRSITISCTVGTKELNQEVRYRVRNLAGV